MEEAQKAKLLRSLTMLAFAVSFVAVVYGLVGLKQYTVVGSDVPAMNTITVSGEGEAIATADVATFTFGVSHEAETAKEAQAQVTEIMNQALAYLDEQEVEEKDVKTTNYSVYPRYDFVRIQCITFPCDDGRRELRGYEVSQSVQVKVRDLDNAGTVLGGLGEIGVTNVGGLNFSIDDPDALMREARQEAIAEAKAEAKALAEDLGVRLVRITHFSEGGRGGRYMMAKSTAAFFDEDAAMMLESVPEIPVGENTITSNVTITFEIR